MAGLKKLVRVVMSSVAGEIVRLCIISFSFCMGRGLRRSERGQEQLRKTGNEMQLVCEENVVSPGAGRQRCDGLAGVWRVYNTRAGTRHLRPSRFFLSLS